MTQRREDGSIGGMNYTSLSDYFKSTYHTKVYKLSLSSGCSCPNRDGKIATGGCTFCSAGGSGDFAAPFTDIEDQLRFAKEKVDGKFSKSIPKEERRYFAYFQSYTNTYGDPQRLKGLYERVLQEPDILGLSIGTRPDCISEEMLGILAELNRKKPIWVELGLQTIKEESAKRIRRGYELPVFEETYRRLKEANLTVVVHLILGLPGESVGDMKDSVSYLARMLSPGDGVKLQLLHVLKGTKLAEEYEEEPFHILTLEEYTRLVVDALRILPENLVIHRITGDGPKSLLIEPKWSGDKKRVLNTLNQAIKNAVREESPTA